MRSVLFFIFQAATVFDWHRLKKRALDTGGATPKRSRRKPRKTVWRCFWRQSAPGIRPCQRGAIARYGAPVAQPWGRNRPGRQSLRKPRLTKPMPRAG